MLPKFLRSVVLSLSLVTVIVGGACTAEASRTSAPPLPAETGKPDAAITIAPNSPADTVRAFYTRLREGKFREAIHLTNLRPAIEGLTDDELKEFSVDFAAIARLVPAELEINGEIISGENATVTAKLPGDDPDTLELQAGSAKLLRMPHSREVRALSQERRRSINSRSKARTSFILVRTCAI